jgi:TRAP-type C4-dicarboxylate transport system substrate-binding protein
MMSETKLITLSDLKGEKVWIPEGDRVGFAALRALGVAPVVMPVTDVMTGLQTDLLDCVTVPPVGAIVFQWHTQLRFVTDVPVAYVYAALLVDKRAFSRMAEADQQVVREVMEGIYRKFDRNGVRENDEALQALLQSGLELVSPDPSEVEEWRRVVSASHRDLGGQGVFDPALYDRVQNLLDEYRKGRQASAP